MSRGKGAAIKILENRIQQWPDELKLLVSCLRMGLHVEDNGPHGPVALLHPINRMIDWEKFLYLADRHRVIPWVDKASERLRESGAPEEVIKRLAHATRANTARMMRLMGERIRILDLFKSAGIAALPLKGPALALWLHGNLQLRQVRDLDILVHPGDVDRALEVLIRGGYSFVGNTGLFTLSPKHSVPKAKKRRIYKRHRNQCELIHDQRKINVEIHWSLSLRLYPVNLKSFQGKIESAHLADHRIPFLHRDQLLLFLAAHGAHHAWRRLIWLVDFAHLFRHYSEEQMDARREDAAKVDVHRCLEQGVVISNRVFGTRMPSTITEVLKRKAATFFLTRHALDQIRAEEGSLAGGLPTARNGAYTLRLRRSMRCKILTARTFLHSADNLFEVRLPDSLTGLYFFLRPLLLLKRFWQQRRVRSSDD